MLWGSVALLYFLSGKLSLYLSVESSIVTLAIFFAEGVSLAAVLIYGEKVWPGIFIGQFILALSSGLDIAPSLFIAAVNSAEAILAYRLFKYFHFDRRLYRLNDLYLLFAIIIFVLQPFSALLGNLGLILFSVNNTDMFYINLFSWWFGNAMGQMLVAPILLVFYRDRYSVNYRLFGLTNLFFLLFCYVLFFLSPISNLALLLSMSITIVVMIMGYSGFVYAMSSILILSVISLLSMHLGVGPFTVASNSTDNLININFYIFAHIFIVYVYGVLLEEKNEVLEKLESMNDHLEEKVKEEIEKRQEKEKLMLLQSRQAQMGEMISMIAHQWRQPLNTLSLVMQNLYIKYQLKALDDTYIEKFREDASRQIHQMSTTIEDFRMFFKPQKEKHLFNVPEIVNHVIEMLDPLYMNDNITIKYNIEEEAYVDGYANEFAQVLINIINNAKDAIVQNIQDVPRSVEVHVEKKKDTVYVMIKDHAGGIDHEILQRIFEPYFSTKHDKEGTGLGLYMSKIIIEKHMGGRLYAQNHTDGARFVIVLGTTETY